MEKIIYAKLSNDRAEQFHIQTLITENNGAKRVVKKPDSPAAFFHVMAFEEYYRQLAIQYVGTRFEVNRCRIEEQTAVFDYITGPSLEEEADRFLIRGQKEQAEKLLLDVAEKIQSGKSVPFAKTSRFEEVFGCPDTSAIDGKPCGLVSDVDLILPNILVRDGQWIIIDYEWTFHFPIPFLFIVYRMLRYYVEATPLRQQLNLLQLCQKAGITEEEIRCFEKMEEAFQAYVDGSHLSLRKLYHIMGKRVVDAKDVCRRELISMQVFYDSGSGCSEEDSYRIPLMPDEDEFDLIVPVPKGVQMVRIDPMDDAGIVILYRLRFKNAKKAVKYKSNGKMIADNIILFPKDDPMLLIPCAGQEALQVRLRVEKMSRETMNALAAAEFPKEKKGFFRK